MKKKILILDDDVQLAVQWSQALTTAGYEVLMAHSADDALHVFSANEVDLCIVDFIIRTNGIPKADGGITFLGQMDTIARKSTKILGVSGIRQKVGHRIDPKAYLMRFGAEEFLSKPFHDDELVTAVSELLVN